MCHVGTRTHPTGVSCALFHFNNHVYVARHCMFLCVCAFVLSTGYYGSGIAAYWPYKLTVQQHASLSREEEESKETFLHAK